jgi:hypothetical protein
VGGWWNRQNKPEIDLVGAELGTPEDGDSTPASDDIKRSA